MKKVKGISDGITLIALVITIIVLLILAGISISVLTGSGLFEKASYATEEYEKEQLKEELKLAILDIQLSKMENGKEMTREDLLELKDIGVQIETTESPTEIEYGDYVFEIDDEYNVKVIEKLIGEKPNVIIKRLTEETEEKVLIVKVQIIATTTDGEIKLIESLNGAILDEENSDESKKEEKIFILPENGEYIFRVTGTNGRKTKTSIVVDDIAIGGDSVLKAISRIDTAGEQVVTISGKNNENLEEVDYSLNVIIHKGDLILDGETEVEGATLLNNVYEFGNEKDVAQDSSSQAQNTVVLKVEGNLTIEDNVTLTSVKSNSGYGGPKGMIIYCTGTLTNNGNISMTARGAKAQGQNIYLWGNKDGSYEFVPANGAAAGASVIANSGANSGNGGVSGTERMTGGGGSGASFKWIGSATWSGTGSIGTSYSGGTGGGAACEGIGGQSGINDGGKGGNGSNKGSTGQCTVGAGGGAGNPGGTSYSSYSSHGANGTGGLLVIYSDKFINEGTISSNGSAGGSAYRTGGGGSGGGSINIFYKTSIIGTSSSIVANGGSAGRGTRNGESANGGAGGRGCVTKGNIKYGTFEEE